MRGKLSAMEVFGTRKDKSQFSKKYADTCKTVKLFDLELVELDLWALADSPTLVSIDIAAPSLEKLDLSPLARIPRLKKLSLHTNAVLSLDPLREAKELTDFKLYKSALTHLSLEPFAALPKLKELGITECLCKSIDLTPLKEHPSLDKFYCARHPLLEEMPLDALASIKKFRALVLPSNPKLTIDLSPLVSKKLRVLNVEHAHTVFLQLSSTLTREQALRFLSYPRVMGDIALR